jgi:hypothetical protein
MYFIASRLELKSSMFWRVLIVACAVVLHFTSLSVLLADGMPDQDRSHKKSRKRPTPLAQQLSPQNDAPKTEAPRLIQTRVINDEKCDWNFRLSAGMASWFFEKENNLSAPSLALDFWRSDVPLNIRLGIEGRHMYLGQDAAIFAQEAPEKTTRITYLRIPFALEYIQPIAEDTNVYLGGGPDILHSANDVSETSVGGHIGARIHVALTEDVGLSIEGGYMWARLDGDSKSIVLDGAYVTPAIAYTF